MGMCGGVAGPAGAGRPAATTVEQRAATGGLGGAAAGAVVGGPVGAVVGGAAGAAGGAVLDEGLDQKATRPRTEAGRRAWAGILKFFGSVVGIIFLIGLVVVIGLLALDFLSRARIGPSRRTPSGSGPAQAAGVAEPGRIGLPDRDGREGRVPAEQACKLSC